MNKEGRLDDSLSHSACYAAHHSCCLQYEARGWRPAVLGDDSCSMCGPLPDCTGHEVRAADFVVHQRYPGYAFGCGSAQSEGQSKNFVKICPF